MQELTFFYILYSTMQNHTQVNPVPSFSSL